MPPGNFNKALAVVLEHEGSTFTNDPVDPGGATRWGMSLRYLLARGDLDGDGLPDGDVDGDGDVDALDVQHMTRQQAAALYLTGFWLPNMLDKVLDAAVSTKIMDTAVNVGSKQAWRIAQRAVNRLNCSLNVDGKVGPKTLAAVNSAPVLTLLPALCQAQKDFYVELIELRPKLSKYRRGWLRRAAWPFRPSQLGWTV